LRGIQKGQQAFWQETKRGSYVAMTGVYPRPPIQLLEGATYQIQPDKSITFILSDGTIVPALSQAGFEAVRTTLPPEQQALMDNKLYWHLQLNPAIPLIAAGLERGEYRELVSNQVFDTDTYYLKPFLGYLFWAAGEARVPLEELLPLVEIHLITLEYPYLRESELSVPSGSIQSFFKYEQDLTNKQYLLRSLLQTPVEPWARLEAILSEGFLGGWQ
jgi:hypothetical protein